MEPRCAPPVSPGRIRKSLPRVLRGEFPCFHGTMKMCDSLRPSRRASLPSLGDTMCCACRFAPVGPERQTAGPGFVLPVPAAGMIHMETTRVSQVPGEPCCAYALFSDPGGPTYQALTVR